MNPRATYALNRLSSFHSRAIASRSSFVHPIADDVVQQLHDRYDSELGSREIRAALNLYRQSRAYFRAIAEGKAYVDIDGRHKNKPSVSECQDATKWLERWSIENCKKKLRENLSADEKFKILSLLESDYRECVVESSFFARSSQHDKALAMRVQMLDIATLLYDAQSTSDRYKNFQYARYYHAISASVVSLLAGNFTATIEHSKIALIDAEAFAMSKRFFPNYFFDLPDIASYEIYVHAVEMFKDGQFGGASELFRKWLILNQHRRGIGNVHYDCNLVHFAMSAMLEALATGVPVTEKWNDIDALLVSETKNIYRTSRALMNRLQSVRLLSSSQRHLSNQLQHEVRDIIEKIVTDIRDDWRLLCVSAPLRNSEDRAASLVEEVRLPTMLDVFERLDPKSDAWRHFLLQILRNMLILKADYETKFAKVQSKVSIEKFPILLKAYEIERLDDKQLVDYLQVVIAVRGGVDVKHFDKSIQFWRAARNSIDNSQFVEAIENAQEFVDILRSFPHVVRTETCEEIVRLSSDDQFRKYFNISVSRIWQYQQESIEFEAPFSIELGRYHYMRAGWNRSLKSKYRIGRRFDPILESRVPDWMMLFREYSLGNGPAPSHRFNRWHEQIEPKWRAVVMRLLTRFRYWTKEDVRADWKRLYQAMLPADAKGRTVIFVGVGPVSKSGVNQLYPLRQALEDLPESELAIDLDTAFVPVETLGRHFDSASAVVFVDDIIGSGDTAIKFFRSTFDKHPWLANKQIYFIALAAFPEGKQKIVDFLAKSKGRVLAAHDLSEADIAFSESNSLWDDEKDREAAKDWCEKIGAQLLEKDIATTTENVLGWKGLGALLAFEHNTPNNTLPIFWASGIVDGRTWQPLFPRI